MAQFKATTELSFFTHVATSYTNSLRKQKSSTPTGLVWDTNMAAVLLFWDTNMDKTSCELLATLETRRKLGRVSFAKDVWVRY